jgi:hypothetical protein
MQGCQRGGNDGGEGELQEGVISLGEKSYEGGIRAYQSCLESVPSPSSRCWRAVLVRLMKVEGRGRRAEGPRVLAAAVEGV